MVMKGPLAALKAMDLTFPYLFKVSTTLNTRRLKIVGDQSLSVGGELERLLQSFAHP